MKKFETTHQTMSSTRFKDLQVILEKKSPSHKPHKPTLNLTHSSEKLSKVKLLILTKLVANHSELAFMKPKQSEGPSNIKIIHSERLAILPPLPEDHMKELNQRNIF